MTWRDTVRTSPNMPRGRTSSITQMASPIMTIWSVAARACASGGTSAEIRAAEAAHTAALANVDVLSAQQVEGQRVAAELRTAVEKAERKADAEPVKKEKGMQKKAKADKAQTKKTRTKKAKSAPKLEVGKKLDVRKNVGARKKSA